MQKPSPTPLMQNTQKRQYTSHKLRSQLRLPNLHQQTNTNTRPKYQPLTKRQHTLKEPIHEQPRSQHPHLQAQRSQQTTKLLHSPTNNKPHHRHTSSKTSPTRPIQRNSVLKLPPLHRRQNTSPIQHTINSHRPTKHSLSPTQRSTSPTQQAPRRRPNRPGSRRQGRFSPRHPQNAKESQLPQLTSLTKLRPNPIQQVHILNQHLQPKPQRQRGPTRPFHTIPQQHPRRPSQSSRQPNHLRRTKKRNKNNKPSQLQQHQPQRLSRPHNRQRHHRHITHTTAQQ